MSGFGTDASNVARQHAARHIVDIYVDLGKLPGEPVIAGAMAAQFALRGFDKRAFADGLQCALEQGWLYAAGEDCYALTPEALSVS